MEFRQLGPLEVVDGGTALPLGGPRQRALLAFLLIHRNHPVAAERIIDALWERDPPRTAAQIVRVYVSHLRKLVGSDVLPTHGAGYVLRVADDDVDAARFERRVAEGRALAASGRAAAAVEAFDEALATWRGEPLPELAYDAFAQPEIARLEELRLAALEDRFDAALADGRDAELVAPLEHLVAAHPLRERLRAQLMLALYRAGRQADALAAYHDGRRLLVDELGIEPGDALRRLETRILQHDTTLEREAVAREPPAPAARARRRGALLVGAVALVAAGSAGAYAVLHDGTAGAHVAAHRALRVASVDPVPKPAPAAEDPVVEEPIDGMRSAAARLGLKARVYWNGLVAPAAAWADLVVVGAAPNLDGVAGFASAKPQTTFLVPDSVTRRDSPFRGLRNVTGLAFDDRELGYLAGVLAALTARPGSAVSAVGGIAVPAVTSLIAGYAAGARSIHPRIRVLVDYTQTFVDQSPCEDAAGSQIDRGSTVVFDVAGSCGYGAMQAAGIRGVWGIGVDSDMSYLGPQILASAVKRLDRATELGVALFARGALPRGGDLKLNLANDAIGLVGISDRVPPGVRARLERVAARLRARDTRAGG